MLIVDAFSLRNSLDYSQILQLEAAPAFVFSIANKTSKKFIDKLRYMGFTSKAYKTPETMYAAISIAVVDAVTTTPDIATVTIVSQHPGVIPLLVYLTTNTEVKVTYISNSVPDFLAKLVTFVPAGKYIYEKAGTAPDALAKLVTFVPAGKYIYEKAETAETQLLSADGAVDGDGH